MQVLFARDGAGLEETQRLVLEANRVAHVIPMELDLSDLESIEPCWIRAVEACTRSMPSPVDGSQCNTTAVLVNNAGTLGELNAVRSYSSLAAIRSAVDINVTSTLWLSSLFLKYVHALAPASVTSAGEGAAKPPHSIVNVSSLSAIKPFPTQSLYSTVKAARDMFHAAIATEEDSKVSVPSSGARFLLGGALDRPACERHAQQVATNCLRQRSFLKFVPFIFSVDSGFEMHAVILWLFYVACRW